MSLIFTKDFFKDGSNDRFGVFETNDNLAWLGSFLMDDGGVGVLHLLKMSESLLKEIQENASSQEEIYQYRENFGVIINGDIVQIDSLLTDEIVSVISTKIFTEKLKECINFIKKNYTTEFEQAWGGCSHSRILCFAANTLSGSLKPLFCSNHLNKPIMGISTTAWVQAPTLVSVLSSEP